MECNRDEAVRAKEIADTKLENQDIPGAKKFAMKAQSLYPQLEGLSQLMTTIDVYVSSSNKVSGEVDWYGVLGVNPAADEDTVKKQYRKLALLLHPDKNKSPGADGAFKLICEAWNLLSDKSKRLAYNQRRSPKGFFPQNVPVRSNNSVPSQSNGVFGYPSRASSTPKPQVPPPKPQVPPPKPQIPTRTTGPRVPVSVPNKPPSFFSPSTPPVSTTFWTICHGCRMHYEYLRKYINHTLLCPNCEKAFLATESPAPFKPMKSTYRQRPPNTNNHAPAAAGGGNLFSAGRKTDSGSHSTKNPNSQQYMHSQTTGIGRSDPSISVKAVNVVHLAQERMKREHYASLHTGSGSKTNVGEGSSNKKARIDEDRHQHGAYTAHNRMSSSVYAHLSSLSAPRKSVFDFDPGLSSFYNKPNNSTRELTPRETRNMLMGKARKAILEKLNERKSHSKTKAVNNGKERKNENGKRKAVIGLDDSSDDSISVGVRIRIAEKLEKPVPEPLVTEEEKVPIAQTQSMDVPDSDFHDFDQDRTERCFMENDVWAGYDDDDGMPRFYAIINKVISREPFKLKVGWINSKTNTEFSSDLNWVGSGFYKTCGEFRLGRYEINKSINVFSHKVNWTKGPRGIMQIYPKKGDVWALYRNWASDWNENTPEEVIHKYDMVVVLEDYLEGGGGGVSVAPLVKVVGFKTIFCPNSDPDKTIRVPKEEMFRFSHQVPRYVFTGEESLKAPKGCLELDPAATPLELLEIGMDKNAIFSQVKDDKAAADGVTKISEFEVSMKVT